MQYNDERLHMNLDELRKEIDAVDKALLTLIGKRLEVVARIGELKKHEGRAIKDQAREDAKIESLTNQNSSKLLDKKKISKIWNTFFEIAYEIEE